MPSINLYTIRLKRFMTSQYIYAGIRMALAIVVPSVILAYFGLLKEYFLFPLGTAFIGFTDFAGPFIRRRNALIMVVVCFFFATLSASFLRLYPLLTYLGIIIFGVFFTMLGIYGQRMASVGVFTLVAFSIFIDGQLTKGSIVHNILVFTAGSIWFLIVFMISFKLQPYRLAGQMIGENYIQLASYFRLKAKFYVKKADDEEVNREIIAMQVALKNLQESTREVVFKTRIIVNEATTQSRVLMLMFLNSINLYDKMMTDINYKKLKENFGDFGILEQIHEYMEDLSGELSKIGLALQSGDKKVLQGNFIEKFEVLYQEYFELRSREISSHRLEDFMNLRFVLSRISEITEEIQMIFRVYNQDLKLAKSLSTGLDFEKFVPQQEQLNLKIMFQNFSLKSAHFRHAIRVTLALLIGFAISRMDFLGIGHSYWIFITILAILRSKYSITKARNQQRVCGTIFGAVVAYGILTYLEDDRILLGILLGAMVLCFALLTKKYSWAVFFMTIYVFIGFNFLNPNHVDIIFKDRLIDTFIAAVIGFGVSYFVFPMWEHRQSLVLMKQSVKSNLNYFEGVMNHYSQICDEGDFRQKRKDAIISLANLSDNFQKMLSDPKDKQTKVELVHQFVNTSHLATAYIASLAQYIHKGDSFGEIDWVSWKKKISLELNQILALLDSDEVEDKREENIEPEDQIENLLNYRKKIVDEAFPDNRDRKKITKLTELKNLREILELLYDVVSEQKKIARKYHQK